MAIVAYRDNIRVKKEEGIGGKDLFEPSCGRGIEI
jgi:hypothetical protein